MLRVDERTERLICRMLDGELSAEEQLELNRELIRNPDAHRLMDEYARLDGFAAATLHDALDRDETATLPQRTSPSRVHRLATRRWRVWWLAPGAVAAALLAVVAARLSPTAPDTIARVDETPRVHRLPANEAPTLTVGFPADNQPRIQRKTNRNGYGVLGEDGTLYWIEVDHVRTLTRPSPQAKAQLYWGGM